MKKTSVEVQGFTPGTELAVIVLVSLAVKTGQRVRIWYGDPQTGESWEIEDNVTGVIVEGPEGLSLKKQVTSKYSRLIPTDCIVRLIIGSVEVYKHPDFRQPEYCIEEQEKFTPAPWWVSEHRSMIVVKRFYTRVEAERWIEYMKGQRMNLSGRKDGV